MKPQKVIDFNQHWKNKVRYRIKLLSLENEFTGRVPRGRPRDPVEEKLLLRLDLARWQEKVKKEEIVKITSHCWQIKI
jgi:hypothetical protein